MTKDIMMIYADKNLNDIGVLQDYSFDECYGDEDNTFELKVQQYNHVCQEDYFVYVEFTEYGGIVDRVISNTKNGVITYVGRTWHGILNSYVIEPEQGKMYRIFNGTANNVIQQIINMFNLGSIFVVDDSLTPNNEVVQITNFNVRYEKAFDAILRMLNQKDKADKKVTGKVLCRYTNGKVHIYTRYVCNYANNEEFDTSQVPFKVGRTYNNVNHLVCLGQGNGADRAVIHLFTNGKNSKEMTIQPYKLVATPLEDAEYILDKRNQVMFGKDEMTEIYDYPNAEIIINYKPLTTEPADWKTSYYKKYYVKQSGEFVLIEQKFIKKFEQILGSTPPEGWDASGGYKQYYYIENGKLVNVKSLTDAQITPQYIALTPANGFTNEPADWKTGYSTYLQWSDTDQAYIAVKGETITISEAFGRDKRPNDWESRYSSYFTRRYDGVQYQYDSVRGNQETSYYYQDSKPTDWDSNWRSYYGYVTALSYTDNNGVNHYVWEYTDENNVTYYLFFLDTGVFPLSDLTGVNYIQWKDNKSTLTKKTETVAPDWYAVWDQNAGTGGIWRRYNKTYWPDFVNDGRYFYKKMDYTPAWRGDGYYWRLVSDRWEDIPAFKSNQYFYQVEDRITELVKGGLERLNELCDTSSLNVNLELTENYDVGDIIGSIDTVTGIRVNKAILRKIIRIKKDIVSIEHQVE